MTLFAWVLAVASAGDVWVTVQSADADGNLKIHVPAVCVGAESNATLDLANGQKVDLQAVVREVQAANVGTVRSFDVPGDAPGRVAHVTLTHEAPPSSPPAITTLALSVLGPKGLGMTITAPLDHDGIGKLMSEVDLGRAGALSLKVDEESALAVVRRYPPTTLVEVTGKDGGTLKVASR